MKCKIVQWKYCTTNKVMLQPFNANVYCFFPPSLECICRSTANVNDHKSTQAITCNTQVPIPSIESCLQMIL